ncbi:MAG: PUA domain-containing protein [Promethearchaeati archaeon SRVP18_Atabeyarchaeia-1]
MRDGGGKWTLRKIRMIADYQFSDGAGILLFPSGVSVSSSPRTGKIKEIRDGDVYIATLNPKSGVFSLSIDGARRLVGTKGNPIMVVRSDFVSEIAGGGNVFAKHVAEAEPGIRAGNEAVAVSEDSSVLATGRSLLCGDEAKRFKRGVAIKVRRGVNS